VRDAKKSGEKQLQVQQTAIKAGWPAAAVSQAVAHVYGTSNQSLSSSGTAEPSWNAGTEPQTGTLGGVAQDGYGEQSIRPALGATPEPSPNAVNALGSVTGLHVPYEYQIGAGDMLQISVWKEPEASASVVVRPDGMISTPLLKEIQVAGLTPKQAEKLITEKLVKVIQEPDVTVVVTGMNSKKIYIIGAVKKEGPLPYAYSMTVIQAISEAGGLTDYAKRKRIYVLRNEKGNESRFLFDYDEVLKGNHMELNIQLLPGDTLVVPH
jgi:polysaccharide export outer membrane protein